MSDKYLHPPLWKILLETSPHTLRMLPKEAKQELERKMINDMKNGRV